MIRPPVDSSVGRLAAPLGALALLITASLAAAPPTGLDAPIVVTQVPLLNPLPAAPPTGSLVRTDWFDGARLIVVSPEGQLRVLSRDFHSACDPNISFDGLRVLFAGKKQRADHWRVWEMNLEGGELRAISPESLDARSPIHVSTLFTLDSPQPWYTTVFVARTPALNEIGHPTASSLYNVKLDGTELRRLTFNPNHDLDPFQMWDGRVIYSAERYPNEPGRPAGWVGLYAIHIEGADMELYGASQAKRIRQMPCATDDGFVVFVESDQATGEGAGQLACILEQRPHVTYQPLTTDPAFVYLHPAPLQPSRLLAARRKTLNSENYAIIRFDIPQRLAQTVFDSPDHHDVQAVLAAPRRRPDGHSTVVAAGVDYGTFYGLNAYDADARMAPHLATGMIKRVRLIEGVPQNAGKADTAPPGSPGPFVPRRLVGEAPVEADGSFNIQVPADIPLLLQTLDDRGLALANCGWIWVKPKETRGCIGCHEDPERIPENEYVLALRRPSNRLLLPPDQRRSVSFRHEIAPLLRQHCATADCHGDEHSPLHLPLTANPPNDGELRQAYDALLAPRDPHAGQATIWPWTGRYVDAGRARTSWLVWQLHGTDTSRPWDHSANPTDPGPTKVNPMPPPGKGQPLSPEALRTIVQWIDLGAQFDAPVAAENPAPTEVP